MYKRHKDSLALMQKFLENMTEADKAELVEHFKDETPKGWISIEDHLPHMLAMDIEQGYTEYKVRCSDGSEGVSWVSDHNMWYYRAKEAGITHWINE